MSNMLGKSLLVFIYIILIAAIVGCGTVDLQRGVQKELPAIPDQTDSSNVLEKRFEIRVGWYTPSFQSQVQVTSQTLGLGPMLNLEKAFNLPVTKNIFRINGLYKFSPHHSVILDYYSTIRNGTSTITRDIQIGNLIIPVGSITISENRFTIFKAAYRYSILNNEEIET